MATSACKALQVQDNVISDYYLWFTELHSAVMQKRGLSVDWVGVIPWCPRHGRSTITSDFSLSWELAQCTGSLPCAELCTKLVGGVNAQS